MNFRLDTWCDAQARLDDPTNAVSALGSLKWALTRLETPEPIALDLHHVSSISPAFADAFFIALLNDPPESLYGPHPLLISRASPAVAASLRGRLKDHRFHIPIALET